MNVKTKQISSALDHILQTPIYQHPQRFNNLTIDILGTIIGEHLLCGEMSFPVYDRQTQTVFVQPRHSGEKYYTSPRTRKHLMDLCTGRVI